MVLPFARGGSGGSQRQADRRAGGRRGADRGYSRHRFGCGGRILGAAFAAGTFGAAALAAGVGIAGSLAINALIRHARRRRRRPPSRRRTRMRLAPPAMPLAPGDAIPFVIGASQCAAGADRLPLCAAGEGEDEYRLCAVRALRPAFLERYPRRRRVDRGCRGCRIRDREGWDDDTPISLVTQQGFMVRPADPAFGADRAARATRIGSSPRSPIICRCSIPSAPAGRAPGRYAPAVPGRAL